MSEKIAEVKESAYQITLWIRELEENWGIPNSLLNLITATLQIVAVVIIAYLFQLVAKKLITIILNRISKIKKLRLAGYLIENRFPTFVALIVPLTWIRNFIPIIFENHLHVINFMVKLSDIFIVLIIYWLFNSCLKSILSYLNSFPKYQDKPIESYFQVVKIVIIIFLIGTFFAIITDLRIYDFFKGMGAASAVFMLIFKDSILGFVSSIVVSTNDMVRIGDWITIPKHNADGDVLQITLTTVKIRNFDKTISTVPTYSLVSDSFQNWRGMKATGARRIKRSFTIKQATIRYIEKDEVPRFEKIQNIKEYISERQEIINEFNLKIGADKTLCVNGRNMTNLGLYRQYALKYLQMHPDVRQDMNVMVRQLQPSQNGLPIEIYCFANTTVWAEYETIMSDIFDHLMSAVVYFDLKIYERASEITFDSTQK